MHNRSSISLTYDSNVSNRNTRRKASLKDSGLAPKIGYDRDEFPYATTMEGGKGAAVNYVPLIENRSHGGYLGAFIRFSHLKTGDIIQVVLVPKKQGEKPRLVPQAMPYLRRQPESKNVNKVF